MQHVTSTHISDHLDTISDRTTSRGKAASNHRARWAAFGAAVAVSLGAGGLGIVSATAPDGASAYVPITPCRLVDTRPGSQVGPQAGALGPDTAFSVTGRGTVPGTCDGVIPDTATALQLNVTAVNATQATFLTLYPQGAIRPLASNVNVDGPTATPNAAAVTLNAANGQFDVYNRFGSVDVVIDVAGFYTDHQHDGDDIVDDSLDQRDVKDAPGVAYAWSADGDYVSGSGIGPKPTNEILDVTIVAPATGFVTVTANANVWGGTAGYDNAICYLDDGTPQDGSLKYEFREHTITDGESMSISRTYPVDEGAITNYRLRCSIDGMGYVQFEDVYLTATYVPAYVGLSLTI